MIHTEMGLVVEYLFKNSKYEKRSKTLWIYQFGMLEQKEQFPVIVEKGQMIKLLL